MSDLAEFRVNVSATGRGAVEVNGEDVSGRVSAVEFASRVGQPPLLRLFMVAEGEISGRGVVQVVPDGQPAGTDVAAFLADIDPDLLEKEVLRRCGWGNDNTMEVALAVLQEWAGRRG